MLRAMAVEEEVPDLTSPYSFTAPVITASAFTMPANFTISSGEGAVGSEIPARVIPRFTSPMGSTYAAPVDKSLLMKTSLTRSAAVCSRV